ncbi:hypothetical protein [Kordia sp.]|uniref:hypothetical protein n=1 Tax=Kordia sp. TaxID=1965332 RepID=UPI0025C728E1|nr:hypothetical protein [Kordia sp.]MCH2197047.1 hypothetical protein [Kordia sp.]
MAQFIQIFHINDKKIQLYINIEGYYSNVVMVINSQKLSDLVEKEKVSKKEKEDSKSKEIL